MRVRSGTLRYGAIADRIREQIAAGGYCTGDVLPSQSALAEQFQTTVTTVRQALRVLHDEGLVELRHGVGSFVTGLHDRHRGLQLASFPRTGSSARLRTETEVLERLHGVAPVEVLRVFSGRYAEFSALKRLRRANGRPVMFQESYLPPAYADVVDAYTIDRPLYSLLSVRVHRVISSAEEQLDAVPAGPEVAGLLKIAENCPCLRSARVSRTVDGEAVLYDIAYMVGGAVRVALQRNGRYAELEYTVCPEEWGDGEA